MEDVRFLPAGDTALVVEFGAEIDRGLSNRVLSLSERVRQAKIPGVTETVPTFRSLAVHYDPLVTSAEPLVAVIREFLAGAAEPRHCARLWRVPACYEEHCAPDLADVARKKGLSIAEVVRLHSEVRYHVYMVGFVPGYPYMGDLPAELALPRRTDPRVRVQAGSIAIATQLTAIYPIESPGGWHLIGTTPVRLFDPSWKRPALLSPGDTVQFEPISWSEYDRVRRAVAAGAYTVPCERLAS
jgi:inhibitor of KinA